MGLFKDFKDDFSQAVNELVPGGEAADTSVDDTLVVDTLNEKVNVEDELKKLDGLLEKVEEQNPSVSEKFAEEFASLDMEEEKTVQPAEQKTVTKENMRMDTPVTASVNPQAATEETSVITASTTLTGDLVSSGSFDIQGTINGNVTCNGKITVTGTINGNSNSSEFFADVAKIEGEVVSTGTVKVGTGSVIIGNITASSAVIAGAVKGDIDVQGPVVVDTSAVIMGNIKSRSVQINNGAVIEGFCSQCYADIDVQGLFDAK
ncbi:MAG: polymer-forming cytoskeletal protein [Agathobacter sp.]